MKFTKAFVLRQRIQRKNDFLHHPANAQTLDHRKAESLPQTTPHLAKAAKGGLKFQSIRAKYTSWNLRSTNTPLWMECPCRTHIRSDM